MPIMLMNQPDQQEFGTRQRISLSPYGNQIRIVLSSVIGPYDTMAMASIHTSQGDSHLEDGPAQKKRQNIDSAQKKCLRGKRCSLLSF
jgi:hypothetical protein